LLAFAGIVFGLTHLGALTLRVAPERQPLYVRMSDGSIQNKYQFKVLNKTGKDLRVSVRTEGGIPGQTLIGAEEPHLVVHGRATAFTIFVRAPEENIKQEVTDIEFYVVNTEDISMEAEYTSKFTAPPR
jgi:polyferredoxin